MKKAWDTAMVTQSKENIEYKKNGKEILRQARHKSIEYSINDLEYVNKWTNADDNELEPQVFTYAKQRGNGSGNSSHNANKAIEAFVRWP